VTNRYLTGMGATGGRTAASRTILHFLALFQRVLSQPARELLLPAHRVDLGIGSAPLDLLLL
jgi:hypothetical protein